MKRSFALFLPLALVACQDASEPLAPNSADSALPSFSQAQAGDVIPGQYVVVFNDGVADAPGLARQLAQQQGGKAFYTYEHTIKGFAFRGSDQAAAALARNPNVAYVEQDQLMWAVGTQSDATWGIDRVDQRDRPLSTTYNYANTGAGVNAYILDTGIRYSHSEFGTRASFGFDAFGETGADGNGHGTHVAGTVGGTTYGIAKEVSLISVRVLDNRGSGTTTGVIAGIEWVTANHVKPAVANMSLGGGASTALDDAVRASIAKGVTYGLAAGNGDMLGRPQDACAGSPSRVTEGLTVGSTTSSDSESSFSNYGVCVDILAPGSSITSAWYQSDTQTNTISGTSMATPHVVGAAALYLAANPGASPSTVASALTGNASQDKITLHSRSSSGGTPNLLLYTGFISGGSGGTTDNPPTASFTYSCMDLSCNFDASGSSDDKGISSYAWTFGDNTSGSGVTTSHTYASDGSYSATLTVTDGAGQTATQTQTVAVSEVTPGGISLSVSTYKVKGMQHADLSWSGATSTSVDVFRDGSRITTTANDGAYTDNINSKGGGSYTYKVCEAGTNTCSADVTATF